MGEAGNPSCPTSLFFELMEFTNEVSSKYNVLPFEILKQDKDEVIMLINYYVEKADNTPQKQIKEEKKTIEHGNIRVRVNDKTATGGWY